MKVAISLPDPIFEAAEAARKRLGVSRSGFYARAIEVQVRTCQAEEVREALDEVYGSEDSSMDPVLKQLQARALHEEW